MSLGLVLVTVLHLGGATAPAVPVARITLAFVACVAVAAVAILLIRARLQGRPLRNPLASFARSNGAIDVREVRRLSMHAELGLVRHAGREYLLLVQASGAMLLRERDVTRDEQ